MSSLPGNRREPLSRDRILHAAVALADDDGIDSISMRNLARRLDVVPMAIYKHVANKEELLDGMVDVVISEFEPPPADAYWRTAIRTRILSARQALLRHRWASRVIETRTAPTLIALDYMESLVAAFRAGGFSVELTHHVMHALGSRIWGLTQDVFPSPQEPEQAAVTPLAARYPHIIEIATSSSHDEASVIGAGCDDQFEFEFALDLLLDGFERLHREGWAPYASETPIAGRRVDRPPQPRPSTLDRSYLILDW